MKKIVNKFRLVFAAIFAIALFWAGVWVWDNRPLHSEAQDEASWAAQMKEEEESIPALDEASRQYGLDPEAPPIDDGADTEEE